MNYMSIKLINTLLHEKFKMVLLSKYPEVNLFKEDIFISIALKEAHCLHDISEDFFYSKSINFWVSELVSEMESSVLYGTEDYFKNLESTTIENFLESIKGFNYIEI